jgi:hypothetical protein
MPTQLVVRDLDRAWYEQWAYLANCLHTQDRGYNLFTRQDDWEGKFCPIETDAAPYTDFANMTPSLLYPGKLMAPLYRFSAKLPDPQRCQYLATYRLRWEKGCYVVEEKVSGPPAAAPPFQVLFDRSRLIK